MRISTFTDFASLCGLTAGLLRPSLIAVSLLLVAPGCVDTGPDEAIGVTEQPVIQGSAEPDYRYPWQVNLGGCQGVLLSPDWVLTAAHCQAYWSHLVTYRRTDPYTGASTTQTRQVSDASFYPHPGYTNVTSGPINDIALIRVAPPLTIDPYLQTVALPTTLRSVGIAGTVAGYGSVPTGDDAVMHASIPATAPHGCAPDATMFCISSSTTSLCPGDSGSGFVSVENARATVRGIASFSNADPNCMSHRTTDYAGMTDVYAFRGWLLSTMALNDATLAGNTRVRWSGRSARGQIGLGCDNPYGTIWGPTNVVGVEPGANCTVGQSEALVCSIAAGQTTLFGQPLVINSFTMRTVNTDGSATTQSLPLGSSTFASYYGFVPANVTREFTCTIGTPTIATSP